MKQIILIAGKAENGKTLLATCLKEELEKRGERVCIMRYAFYLKTILKEYYGWDGVDKSPHFRTKLQQLGTERIREQMNRPFFHANRVCEDIEIIYDDFDYVIIDDTRFVNEVMYPKAYFPDMITSIKIIRPDHVSKLTPEQLNHPSETGLDGFKDFDYVITVPSGIDNMTREVKIFTEEVLYGI